MKCKTIVLLLILAVVLSFAACGSESNYDDSKTAVAAPVKETEPPKVELLSAGELGDYSAEIKEFELCKDYNGNPAILVSFSFTNNSEEGKSAMLALSYNAYQNGLALASAIIADDTIYNSNDLIKEIQPGYSIDVKAAFSLISDNAPVEFELAEAFSFESSMLGKTFSISEGGITELNVAPGADSAESLGDYGISIISYKLTKDYEGNEAIVVTYGFTNNSHDTTNFLVALSSKAFQDGIQLETAFITDDPNYDSWSGARNVRPGAGLAVTQAYLLTNSSPVQIEIEETFSFNDNKITTEIDVTE